MACFGRLPSFLECVIDENILFVDKVGGVLIHSSRLNRFLDRHTGNDEFVSFADAEVARILRHHTLGAPLLVSRVLLELRPQPLKILEIKNLLIDSFVGLLHDTVFRLVDQGVDALLAAVFDEYGLALFQEFVRGII